MNHGSAGSIPAPAASELEVENSVVTDTNHAGSSKGRMRRSERRDVGSSPTPATPPQAVYGCGSRQPNTFLRFRPDGAHRPTGRHRRRKPEIRVQFPVSPLKTQSRGPTATTLSSHPGNDGSTPSGTTPARPDCAGGVVTRTAPSSILKATDIPPSAGPDTPTGRATRLKPECLQVRLLFWAHHETVTAR